MSKMRTRTVPGSTDYKPTSGAASVESPRTVGEEQAVSVDVILGTQPPGANENMIHVNLLLTRRQSLALRRLRLGLKGSKATCHIPSGSERLVDSQADGIRWLLESLVSNQ